MRLDLRYSSAFAFPTRYPAVKIHAKIRRFFYPAVPKPNFPGFASKHIQRGRPRKVWTIGHSIPVRTMMAKITASLVKLLRAWLS